MKKTLALVVALVLMLSCFGFAAAEETAEKVVIVSAECANAEPGKESKFAVDGDITTRWCAELFDENGCDIVFTFDKEYSFNSFKAAFNKAQGRSYQFTLAISNDGENWEEITAEPINSNPVMANGDFSHIVLDKTYTAKYLKMHGNGYTDVESEEWFGGATDPNNGGPLSWFSIWEIEIPVAAAEAANVVIVSAECANAEPGKESKFAVDGDITTRWCAELFDENGCDIVFTFDKEYSFNGFQAAFNKAQGRSYQFTLAISNDGENWEEITAEPINSNPVMANGDFSHIVLDKTYTAKYLKMHGNGYTDVESEEWFGGATDPNNGGPLSWFSIWEIVIPVVQ